MTQLRAGIQLHLSVLKALRLPELISLGKSAVAGGVTQLWVTDNLNNRAAFTVLGALAAQIPVDLGTAVVVPYFHNPVEVAGAAAAIGELMDGRELSLGIARGNYRTSNLVDTPKPVTFLRETAQSLKRLLAGETVTFDAYPTLASYFHIGPTTPFNLSFEPQHAVKLYCGGNSPLSLAVGGEHMDGLVFGGTFQAVALTGQLAPMLKIFDDAATKAGASEQKPRVAEIKLSVASNRRAARAFAALSAGTRFLSLRDRGYSDEDIARAGVDPRDLDKFEAARHAGASRAELVSLVTDGMIDAIYVAGDPAHCRERLTHVSNLAREHGFEQLMFSEFGPDPRAGLKLLCDELLASL
ncbi:MAG TPA: LLM class flavin-dependent oxidoreductase [Dehalococcoidia bacterium]|nr:LLM class flavin-dependent oxidoreductase [Dehalococcoidia bacterium]